jgi:hypothetical protein
MEGATLSSLLSELVTAGSSQSIPLVFFLPSSLRPPRWAYHHGVLHMAQIRGFTGSDISCLAAPPKWAQREFSLRDAPAYPGTFLNSCVYPTSNHWTTIKWQCSMSPWSWRGCSKFSQIPPFILILYSPSCQNPSQLSHQINWDILEGPNSPWGTGAGVKHC